MENNVDSFISKLVEKARQMDLPYISHYDNLITQYESTRNCSKILRNNFYDSTSTKLQNSFETDPECKLAVYLSNNPDLKKPEYGNIPEFERIKITRYRCGSHYLEIEKGRFQRKNREDRLCPCGRVQTLHHVILDCPLVDRHRLPEINSPYDFFQLDAKIICEFLLNGERRLGVQKS